LTHCQQVKGNKATEWGAGGHIAMTVLMSRTTRLMNLLICRGRPGRMQSVRVVLSFKIHSKKCEWGARLWTVAGELRVAKPGQSEVFVGDGAGILPEAPWGRYSMDSGTRNAQDTARAKYFFKGFCQDVSKFDHRHAIESIEIACETVRREPRDGLGHGWRFRLLFVVILLCGMLVRAEGQTFGYFTNKYSAYGTNFISIAPWTAQGIFYEGDTITISNRLGTTVEVYDYHFNPITNATPPVVLYNLGLGHYFVQVNGIKNGVGDRAQFSVLPYAYTNYPHSDLGVVPPFPSTNGGDIAQNLRAPRLAPGFGRFGVWWSQPTNETYPDGIVVAGTNNWTAVDQELQWNSYLPVKVLMIGTDHNTNAVTLGPPQGNWNNVWWSPAQDSTNTLSDWVNDVALLWSNAAVRYGTNFIYEIMNEPNEHNLEFPTNQDPYAITDPAVLPAAMTVSASVQAIKFVCPTCQTWGPASQGMSQWPMRTVTDSFAIAYYTNIDVISYHGDSANIGPVDNTCAFTNRLDITHACSIDSNLELVASLYPGKGFAITETYPYAPDVLGKTNGWWIAISQSLANDVPQASWDWRTMTTRFWKDLIIGKGSGMDYVEIFLSVEDADIGPRDPPHVQYDLSSYSGWDQNGQQSDWTGCGPRPTVDAQAMISWWLGVGNPITHWLSGTPLLRVTPQGGIGCGTPGLHFWEFQFADGSTNTIVWADEGTTVATNFGVGLTDIFSNAWTGPIGEEPVIAWGWPNNSLGGLFSTQPVAAFTATPSYGSVPLAVTFTDTSSGAITNHFWQFGDGFATNAPALTIVHRYATAATNTVQLIVAGPTGVSSTTQPIFITPFPPPLAGGGINGLPPVVGGTSGNGGGSNSVLSTDNGGASSVWRFMMVY
jgi:PKD domain